MTSGDRVARSLVALLDATGTIVSVNRSWRDVADAEGLTHAGHGIGLNYLTICERAAGRHAEGAAEVAEGIRAVLRGDCDVFDFEYSSPSPRADRTFHVCVAAGEVAGLPGAMITHLEIAAALITGESRLAMALEATSDALWDWNIATDDVFYGRTWLESLGYLADERPQTLATWQDLVHPDDLPATIASLERHLAGETERYEAGYRLRHRDGHYLWSLARGKVVQRDERGRPLRMVGINTDVTRRKQAEELSARLSLAVEQSANSIVITDAAGTIIYVNPAFERASGYTQAEAQGRNPRFLKSGVHDASFYSQMWQTLTRGDVWRGTMVNRRRDGSLDVSETTISPLRNATGHIVNFVAVKRDVTRERELEAQLQEVRRMEAIGRLAGGIAHDFNNILGVIHGYTELMLLEAGPSHAFAIDLEEVAKATERAAVLTRQMLAYSRQQVLQPRVLRPFDLIKETEHILKKIAGDAIDVAITSCEDSPWIRVDPTQFHQALMDLVVNTRDAMPHGGKLTVDVSCVALDATDVQARAPLQAGAYVVVTVSDTGTGMSRETMRRIFDPFFTTKSTNEGTGLGLSTVYGIVRQSGGHVEVSSELGHGTTFKVYFPRVEPREIAAEETAATLPPAHSNETVLLVEDDDAMRMLCQVMLEGFGYRVLSAASGPEALTIMDGVERPVDLLLTDVNMPGMNGRVLADRMLEAYPGLKVLFTSGYTENAIGHHGVLDPGTHFLPKPYRQAALAQAVRDAIDAA